MFIFVRLSFYHPHAKLNHFFVMNSKEATKSSQLILINENQPHFTLLFREISPF